MDSQSSASERARYTDESEVASLRRLIHELETTVSEINTKLREVQQNFSRVVSQLGRIIGEDPGINTNFGGRPAGDSGMLLFQGRGDYNSGRNIIPDFFRSSPDDGQGSGDYNSDRYIIPDFFRSSRDDRNILPDFFRSNPDDGLTCASDGLVGETQVLKRSSSCLSDRDGQMRKRTDIKVEERDLSRGDETQ